MEKTTGELTEPGGMRNETLSRELERGEWKSPERIAQGGRDCPPHQNRPANEIRIGPRLLSHAI